MKTLEELRRRISNVGDMKSVVSSMKTLAAVSIRQYETAVNATRKFDETIQMALQILVRNRELSQLEKRRQTQQRLGRTAIVVFGSDQGLCGRFNHEIASTVNVFHETGRFDPRPLTLTVGTRVNPLLEEYGINVSHSFHVPNSVDDITKVLQDLMPKIESWQESAQVERINVFFNQRTSTATYVPSQRLMLPLDLQWLTDLKTREWPSRSLPTHSMAWEAIFSQVIRQHLFLQLFRACAESRASENASRIASMQQAEKNIEERLGQLRAEFNQHRQRSITEELLDIMSGFEVATSGFRDQKKPH